MSSREAVCDYCQVKYPDQRSLKVHELIHTDEDIDAFSKRPGNLAESDYLPQAKQCLENGMRNDRMLDIYNKKIVPNAKSNGGKQCSKTFFISEAIEELLYMCKKFPIRGSKEMQIAISSPPNCSASVCSSDLETPFIIPPSKKPTLNKSESDVVKYDGERNRADQMSNENSSPDSGYDSPPEEKNSNSDSVLIDTHSVIEIKDIMNNLVSGIDIVSDQVVEDLELTRDSTEFKPGVEKSAPEESAIPGFKTFASFDEDVTGQYGQQQNAPGFVISMPQIPC